MNFNCKWRNHSKYVAMFYSIIQWVVMKAWRGGCFVLGKRSSSLSFTNINKYQQILKRNMKRNGKFINEIIQHSPLEWRNRPLLISKRSIDVDLNSKIKWYSEICYILEESGFAGIRFRYQFFNHSITHIFFPQ